MATTVGEVKIALSFDGKSMDASMKSVASKTQTTAGNIGTNSGNALSKGWAVAIGAISGITQSVFNKVTNVISNSVGSAVKRFDTMNNFPKVMANLGISADKAEASIQKIADNLKGLPTTLDQGASAVQRSKTPPQSSGAADARTGSTREASLTKRANCADLSDRSAK